MILIVGGAGYIGSHMVKALHHEGHEVLTLDNFSTGYRDAVCYGDLIECDLADQAGLNAVFASRRIDAVMHFASYIQVGESVRDPAKYYRNNVQNTQNLLDAMRKQGVLNFIFSSTAAIFGEPEYTPIDERHLRNPINPYGHGKLMVEQMLADYGHAYGLKSVCLRYFNAAGADPEGEMGERHAPETHLVPLVLQAAMGQRESITLFGDDYSTPDGTCIRDYIHVTDLCLAHSLALEKLQAGASSAAYNLGNGDGFSVREVIDTARKVTGRDIPVTIGKRREGDPAVLVADASRARRELDWKPQFGDLETIIAHAWQWEQKRPEDPLRPS